jgi:hypothetical protein
MKSAVSKCMMINRLRRSSSFEREFRPSRKEVYRKHAERRRFMPRDFPVTGCQLRHASSSYTSFFYVELMTHDAPCEQFTGISHPIEQ